MNSLDLKNFEFGIIKYALTVTTVAIIISLIIGVPYVAYGLAVGVVVGSLNFLNLARSVRQVVQSPASKAAVFASARYFMRLITAVVALGVAAYTRNFGFFAGTVLGYFMIKFVIVGLGLLGKVKLNKDLDLD